MGSEGERVIGFQLHSAAVEGSGGSSVSLAANRTRAKHNICPRHQEITKSEHIRTHRPAAKTMMTI